VMHTLLKWYLWTMQLVKCGRMNFRWKQETQQSNSNSKILNASELQLLGFLPGVVWVAKVPIRGSLQVLRFLEVKLADCKASARLGLKYGNTHR
jgi:hypothetical protein